MVRRRLIRLGALGSALCWSCLLFSAAASSKESTPHALLERMNEAVRTLDYEGRFVVQMGDRLDSMYIVHRVDNGAEKERVLTLNGKPREIVRDDQAVACPVPGRDNKVNVGRRSHDRSFSPLAGISAEQLDMSYQLELLSETRVAGRPAFQLLIRPRDDLRYGYRLFIDRETALPLRSVMFDEALQPVSQMMFVDLVTGDAVSPVMTGVEGKRATSAGQRVQLPTDRLARPAWAFSDLPPGFELNVHRRRAMAKLPGESEHFIFSDGLATVSVYIQPHTGEHSLIGESSLGAAKAVGRVVDDHEVIVVGEVPLKTLHLFAGHVHATSQ